MTKTEREILDRVLQLHTGEEAAVYHYVLDHQGYRESETSFLNSGISSSRQAHHE